MELEIPTISTGPKELLDRTTSRRSIPISVLVSIGRSPDQSLFKKKPGSGPNIQTPVPENHAVNLAFAASRPSWTTLSPLATYSELTERNTTGNISRASGENRTRNPRITNAVLCQLKLRWLPCFIDP